MTKIWQSEFPSILSAVFIILITGLVFDQWLVSSALTLSAYIFWLYLRLARLEKWLSRGTKASEVYDDSGIFDELIRHLYHQRKLHNKRKKRTKEILQRLNRNISALPDATVLLNEQMEIEWSNEPARYLLGINPREDLGQRISNLFRHPAFLRYLISPDNKDHLELESPLDHAHILQIKIVRFGRNQRLLTARNISDQKQLQEGLKNFVANASHELRTPLTALSGHLEMLENESKLTADGKKSVKVAQNQSRRMQQLIQDLLLLSQVESYQLQPNEGSKVLISEIMSNVMATIGDSGERENLCCEYPDDVQLLGIRTEIEGICINLIENAIKYSNDEDTPIDITWFANSQGEYVFRVKDQGPGINAQDLPHLTERYFRGSQHLAQQQTGSGLGLAIVKQAAAKHGARLDISSQLNRGSTFSVTFPSYRVFSGEEQPDNLIQLVSL